MTAMEIFWIYLLIINCVLFLTMGIDKGLAVAHKRRVPERTLFLLALIGGALGGTMGMLIFRHKTKHASFYIGFPLIFIVQGVLVFLLLTRVIG